jgi:hypothetical protein
MYKELEETNKKLHKRLGELDDINQALFNKIRQISLDIDEKTDQLTDLLAYEIAKEIDDQIINSTLAGANLAGAVKMTQAAGLGNPPLPELNRKLKIRW